MKKVKGAITSIPGYYDPELKLFDFFKHKNGG